MSTTIETERELREGAEKNFNDLVAFLRGQTPETYNLHVKILADELREQIDTATIRQRDAAERAADLLASAVLGEPIDWPDHEAKWDEALEEVGNMRDEVVAAQFWLAHAERTNTEFEQDYLAIWKAVKEPDKTVLESVLALKARVSV